VTGAKSRPLPIQDGLVPNPRKEVQLCRSSTYSARRGRCYGNSRCVPFRSRGIERQGEFTVSTKLQQSAASLFKRCKPKRVVAVALLLAGSVFGSPAQAAIVQLDLSGPSFSGYLFFNTAKAPGDAFGTGVQYYSGFSYISTPLSTSSSYPYTKNPKNPYTRAPLPSNGSSSYLSGSAFLNANPTCTGNGCSYVVNIANMDGSAADLGFVIRQNNNNNLVISDPNSFPVSSVSYQLYDDGFFSNRLFAQRGTISLPGAIAPPASPVPEPATWALMIGGFGMIGGAARYKRRRTTMTYA